MSSFSSSVLSITEEGADLRVEVSEAITSSTKEHLLSKGKGDLILPPPRVDGHLMTCYVIDYATGGSSVPLLCIQGHEKFDGFYLTSCVADGTESKSILCHSTKAKENSTYLEDNYRVTVHDGKIKLSRKKKREEEGQGGSSLEGGGTTAVENVRIFMLPPLTFCSRTSIFNIDKIDTIAQSFQTDFYCELRLLNVIDGDDKVAIDLLMEHYQLQLSLIDFLNVSEVIGEKEVWEQVLLFHMIKLIFYFYLYIFTFTCILFAPAIETSNGLVHIHNKDKNESSDQRTNGSGKVSF